MSSQAEILQIIADIHEEDIIILKGEDGRGLADKIRDLMYYYAYNRQGSDHICCFCSNRGRIGDDQIEHDDNCDGNKFLRLLERS